MFLKRIGFAQKAPVAEGLATLIVLYSYPPLLWMRLGCQASLSSELFLRAGLYPASLMGYVLSP